MRRVLLLLALLAFGIVGCTSVKQNKVKAEGDIQTPTVFDHSALDEILKTHVQDGLVDYAALKAADRLRPYLQALANTDPSQMSEAEQLAFWINAYNALTLKLVADNYPTKSILRLTPVGIRGIPFIIPKANSPFTLKVGEVGGAPRTLNEIEHEILRVQFDEPRIHFAIVCASESCPPLRAEAFVADRLDAQLDDQTRQFLYDPTKNEIPASDAPNTIRLSKIFNWFAEDFGGKDSLQTYLAPYFEDEVRAQLEARSYEVDFLNYSWALNDWKRTEENDDPETESE